MNKMFSLIFTLLLLKGGMCTDFDVFCELVSLSQSGSQMCSDCSNPCGTCGVTCNDDKTRITEIDARNKKLTALPESIGSLTGLRYLELGNNELTNIPESIGSLTKLLTLHFNNNKLTSIPESIGSLKTLIILDVSQNKLIAVPDSIGNLKRLNGIMLGENSLTSVPESISGLNSLRDLNLDGNKITSLPESIGSLTTLKGFFVNRNKLTGLPDSIGALKSLNSLELMENQLLNIPDSIGSVKYLTYMRLQNNQLTVLPDGIDDLNRLETIHLEGNYFNCRDYYNQHKSRSAYDCQQEDQRKFVITFDSAGGSKVPNVERTYKTKIGVLPSPMKKQCAFACWMPQDSEDCFEETRMPGRNFTLVAKWKPITTAATIEKDISGSNTLVASIFIMAILALILF